MFSSNVEDGSEEITSILNDDTPKGIKRVVKLLKGVTMWFIPTAFITIMVTPLVLYLYNILKN